MTRLLVIVAAATLVTAGCASKPQSPRPPASPPAPASASPGRKPAIVVNTPKPGDVVEVPANITGNANVFEGTVSIRILDENGKVIADSFTTARCGSGCRGRFSTSVGFVVDHEQPGTIEVFETGAEAGEPPNLVQIPVTLSPNAAD